MTNDNDDNDNDDNDNDEVHGTVKVANVVGKIETYALNGVIATVQQAVNRFLGNRNLEEEINGHSIRMDNQTLTSNALKRALRDGDVIMVFNSDSIARGGVKGAQTRK